MGSHEQRVVYRSNTNAKYRSKVVVLFEITWIVPLTKHHVCVDVPTIYSNKLSVVLIVANHVMHLRLKHLTLVQNVEITIVY